MIVKYDPYISPGTGWVQQYYGGSSEGSSLNGVHFTSSLEGWAVGTLDQSANNGNGSPLVMYTADGGATWTQQGVEATLQSAINDVVFVYVSGGGWAGWAVCQDGTILRYDPSP